MNDIKVKPISIFKSIWCFILSSALICAGVYLVISILLDKGVPFLIGYLIMFHGPLVLLLITALVLYKKEGNSWKASDFKSRMRLNPMKKADWFWAIGIIMFFLVANVLFEPVTAKLAQTPFFSPPDFFPAEINPNKTIVPGYMWDYKLSGQYWVFQLIL